MLTNTSSPQPQSTTADYEVHEWGVLVGCQKTSGFTLTSRPERPMIVKQPVVYFYTSKPINITVNLRFLAGKPTLLYPDTTYDETLQLTPGKNTKTPSPPRKIAFAVPEKVFEILNQTNAACVLHGSTRTRFFYYEGEIPYYPEILAKPVGDKTYQITNRGKTAIHNITIVRGEPATDMPYTVHLFSAHLPELKPKESKVVRLKEVEIKQLIDELRAELLARGLTPEEADVFLSLWTMPFFQRSNLGRWCNLIYVLPNGEYEHYVSLTLKPKPKRYIRVIYVLQHVDG